MYSNTYSILSFDVSVQLLSLTDQYMYHGQAQSDSLKYGICRLMQVYNSFHLLIDTMYYVACPSPVRLVVV